MLTPYEAAALICDEDDEGEGGAEGEIEVLDVRTQAQREQHAINERGPGVTVRGPRAGFLRRGCRRPRSAHGSAARPALLPS